MKVNPRKTDHNQKHWTKCEAKVYVICLRTSQRKHTRNTSVLLNHDDVGDVVSSAGVHELLHAIVSPVDSLGVGKHQLHLLVKYRATQGEITHAEITHAEITHVEIRQVEITQV